MELSDRLIVLEKKVREMVSELAKYRSEQNNSKADYTGLLEEIKMLKSEVKELRKVKDTVREKLETLFKKLV